MGGAFVCRPEQTHYRDSNFACLRPDAVFPSSARRGIAQSRISCRQLSRFLSSALAAHDNGVARDSYGRLVYEPHTLWRTLSRAIPFASALGVISTICSQRLHQSPGATGVWKGLEERHTCCSGLRPPPFSKSAAGGGDLHRGSDLGICVSTAAESLCPCTFSHADLHGACVDNIPQSPQQHASGLQILRLGRRRQARP